MSQYNYLEIFGNVEPNLSGTYDTAEERDLERDVAADLQDPDIDSIFAIDVEWPVREPVLLFDGRAQGGAGLYVLLIEGGIEASLEGPFDSELGRQVAAAQTREEIDPEVDGVFYLDLASDGTVDVNSLSGEYTAYLDGPSR